MLAASAYAAAFMPRHQATAVAALRREAERRHWVALYYFGRLLSEGLCGVPQDECAGLKHLMLSADQMPANARPDARVTARYPAVQPGTGLPAEALLPAPQLPSSDNWCYYFGAFLGWTPRLQGGLLNCAAAACAGVRRSENGSDPAVGEQERRARSGSAGCAAPRGGGPERLGSARALLFSDIHGS